VALPFKVASSSQAKQGGIMRLTRSPPHYNWATWPIYVASLPTGNTGGRCPHQSLSAWIKLLPPAAHSSLSMFSHFPLEPRSSCMQAVERRATTSCRLRRRPPLHAPAPHPPPSPGAWKAERSPPRKRCSASRQAGRREFF
jgi:hypothetical protein